jgi:hypothetical protein
VIFFLFEIIKSEDSGVVILDPCSGQVLFAGTIFGLGVGSQIFPLYPIEPGAFENKFSRIRQPQRIDVFTSPESTSAEGFSTAWKSVQSLNLVHDFAAYQYSVFIYLYSPAIFAFRADEAEWLIFLHRLPE